MRAKGSVFVQESDLEMLTLEGEGGTEREREIPGPTHSLDSTKGIKE